MSPAKNKSAAPSAQPTPEQTAVTPAGNLRHILDQDVALTMLMELQRTLGETNATLSGLTKSVDGVKSKVDDLVSWKNKILGGAIALGIAISCLVALIGWASKYVTLKSIDAPVITQAAPNQTAPTVLPPTDTRQK